jgi:hypothetical protein
MSTSHVRTRLARLKWPIHRHRQLPGHPRPLPRPFPRHHRGRRKKKIQTGRRTLRGRQPQIHLQPQLSPRAELLLMASRDHKDRAPIPLDMRTLRRTRGPLCRCGTIGTFRICPRTIRSPHSIRSLVLVLCVAMLQGSPQTTIATRTGISQGRYPFLSRPLLLADDHPDRRPILWHPYSFRGHFRATLLLQ